MSVMGIKVNRPVSSIMEETFEWLTALEKELCLSLVGSAFKLLLFSSCPISTAHDLLYPISAKYNQFIISPRFRHPEITFKLTNGLSLFPTGVL